MNRSTPSSPTVTDAPRRAQPPPSRAAYLAPHPARAADRGPARGRLACANLAHGFAASDRPRQAGAARPRPSPTSRSCRPTTTCSRRTSPSRPTRATLKQAVIRAGGIAQFAGGVPAMCDGITQGRDGMQLSLFSRDVIAMSTAIALSHDMFDGALMLGVCDKIVPGLLIGALSFGHLPTVFVPAGPMTSGLPNGEKARVRQLYAEGKVGREELLEAEAASYHSAGTCTFYGTANSNQLLMEVLGLHLPGSSFVNPGTPLREALTRAAGRAGHRADPAGRRAHADRRDRRREGDRQRLRRAARQRRLDQPHPAPGRDRARRRASRSTWDDLSDLSAVVPLLARIYPNGAADVNHFHAAGGIALPRAHPAPGRAAARRRADRRGPRPVALHHRAACCAAAS